MSWETVYWVSQLLLVVFAGVALISGAVVNKRQSKQLLALETTLEEQRQRTEGLQNDNIKAQSDLEKERSSRIEMEKSLAIREVALFSVRGVSNVEGLKPFAGVKFVVRSLPEAEPSRAAESLISVLEIVGWVKTGREISGEYMSQQYDGVTVSTGLAERSTESERAAAKALVDFLKMNGWEARKGRPHVSTPNVIQITVGFKPAPYFLSKQHEEWRQEFKRLYDDAEAKEQE
jgi:hypothetical protein